MGSEVICSSLSMLSSLSSLSMLSPLGAAGGRLSVGADAFLRNDCELAIE